MLILHLLAALETSGIPVAAHQKQMPDVSASLEDRLADGGFTIIGSETVEIKFYRGHLTQPEDSGQTHAPDHPTVWLAAVQSSSNATLQVTSSDVCPAVDRAITHLGRLPLPSWDLGSVPQFTPGDEIPPTIKDGPAYSVWIRTQEPGGSNAIFLSARFFSGPTGSVIESMAQDLSTCWQPVPQR